MEPEEPKKIEQQTLEEIEDMFAKIAGDNTEAPKRSDVDKPPETLDHQGTEDHAASSDD